MTETNTTKQKGSLLKVICKYEQVNNILANHDEIISDSVEEHSTNMHNLRRMQDDLKSMLSMLENAEQRLNRRVDEDTFKDLARQELERVNKPLLDDKSKVLQDLNKLSLDERKEVLSYFNKSKW